MISNPIKSLFTHKSPSMPAAATTSQPATITQYNQDNMRDGETYTNYGKRICGVVGASNAALAAFLPRIYALEKNRQMKDLQVQANLRAQIQADINNKQTQVDVLTNDLGLVDKEKDGIQANINQLQEDIVEMKKKGDGLNKSANAKMILGLIIIIPLTLYLFIFYSSTFYSAFFKDWGAAENTGLAAAMFDANAIANAWSTGVTELIFVLCAPIIFLGLGFSLHFFTIQQQKTKYLKMAALLMITFIFDAILAYLIGKRLYEVLAINSMEDLPAYSFSLAIADINTWAVIFCGFIVYIIWGIVFDMTYTGYENRRSNKLDLELGYSRLNNEKKKLGGLLARENDINNKIISLKGAIKGLRDRMNTSVLYDPASIQNALNDFFTGWVSIMVPLGKSAAEQEQARKIFQDSMATLFTNSTNVNTANMNTNLTNNGNNDNEK